MSTKIFLSHSSRDKDMVRRLANDLQSSGVDVWLDEWEIFVGDRITQKIQEGLSDCKYLAVWLTKHSVESGWVEREWQTKYHDEVSNNKVVILPLLADECQVPPLLKDKKYADFRSDYTTGLNELLRLFRRPHRKSSKAKSSKFDGAIEKLSDDCVRTLGKSKSSKDEKSYFIEFIQPTYNQFEILHNEYLDCFRKYRKLLKENDGLSNHNHPIFDIINEDHVFSSGTRKKVLAISNALKKDDETVRFFQDGDNLLLVPEMDTLNEMMWLIGNYISGTNNTVYYDDLNYISNFPRSSLYSGLKFLVSASPDKIRALKMITGQNCFDFVMQVSGEEVSSPPILTIEGEKSWDFVLKINSKAQWDNLRNALVEAEDNIEKIKRALGISLIDKIVTRNQEIYSSVTACFEKLRVDYYKD